MNYKFLVSYDARMCITHTGTINYWSVVKQISKEVNNENHREISELMFKYYHETENQKNIIFNIENLDSIDNDTFKAWFGINKNEFQEILLINLVPKLIN